MQRGTCVSEPMSVPYITDITTVRLYDKLFVEGFGKWISQPQDLTQMYTSFIYEYQFELFRWGTYDDTNGYLDDQYIHFKNYDQTFLNAHRFACKELWVYQLEVLEPAPVNYLYRTFYLVGQEAGTGVPFKLAVHDSQVVGTFLLDNGVWHLQSGINPFIEGLSFKTTKIYNGIRVVDLLYYIDGAIDSYIQPLALEHRTRVYMLRDAELAYLPSQPLVSYAPLTTLEAYLEMVKARL